MPNALVRILTAIFWIPVVLYILFQPVVQVFNALVTILCILGMRELFLMFQNRGHRPYVAFCYGMALMVHLSVYEGVPEFPFFSVITQPAVLMSFLVIGLLTGLMGRGRAEENLVSLGLSLFAVMYVAFLSSFMIRLRVLEEGVQWVCLLAAITWGFDAGAYAWGVTFGRTKMWVDVSPGKSWEGFWGGTVSTLAAVWLIKRLPDFFAWFPVLFPTKADLGHLLVLALIGCAAAQLGDLAESMIKRYSRLKDSSNIFPGHGGALDRMDSFLFTAPLVYLDALIVGGFFK